MTVAELIRELENLPQNLPVLQSWEGELIQPRAPRAADCHRFLHSDSASECYYLEVCSEDKDYTHFQAVILE
jgi:hypothetical protein